MPSFLSSAEKASIDAGFSDLHDTFARDIFIYVKTKSVSSDSSFHALYGRGSASSTEPVLEKRTIKARILYTEESKDGLGDLSLTQVNALMPTTKCRLKIHKADYETIKKAERIEVDGEIWISAGEAIYEGPFITEFKTVFLKRKN